MSMDSQRFRVLSARQRALVAVAVLLDGREASTYLENDAVNGETLKEMAIFLAEKQPEMRMPFVGTMLRIALGEMKG